MISIVDYGAGNIRSVQNMLRSIGAPARIASTPEAVLAAERLILPGVGHFDHGIAGLEQRGLIDALHARVIDGGVPFLGICLGAQLIARRSDEGARPGLGWIDADVVAFDRVRMDRPLQVPHMGWAETWISPAARESGTLAAPFAEAIPDDARYYYVHSFHLDCDRPETVVLRARHGYEFAAGVARDNVLGVQFHPEKSHRFGKALLEAFVGWDPTAAAQRKGAA
ncbi:MAG: imidazole glycerol phosphate synthase subunit HisH [Pseudorhodobacter sp.]|nr:imidazole glycerol phosphate synthase subunit HisH [Pseudorhodobacter sp.]